MIETIFKRTVGVILLVLGSYYAGAQAGPAPPGPPPPNPVPISGLEILLGAGALFGVKKILDKRKGNTSS